MLPKDGDNLDELAKRYFVDELGLNHEDVPEAARNLVGSFDVLLRIYDRMNKQPI